MGIADEKAFRELFMEACAKCFGQLPLATLAEPECRLLSTEIEDKTGLVIGWKSIKNYAAFVLNDAASERQVNPSTATLDTLSRYVLDAPTTTEAQRKRNEAHFPWWFHFREKYVGSQHDEVSAPAGKSRKGAIIGSVIVLIAVLVLAYMLFGNKKMERVEEGFELVSDKHLEENGWFVLSKNAEFWNKRGEHPGHLSLFTLEGDNWRNADSMPYIQNLLTRKIPGDCFDTEVHFAGFVPLENWQQAGLILMEDTTYTGKSIRLSIAYNDYFGGHPKPGEIIVQAISSHGKAYKNVEEFVHQPLFSLDSSKTNDIMVNNLKHFAFRVEKNGKTFRILAAASPFENFSFKELAVYEFDMHPKYLGILALKGFVDSASVMPVAVQFFRLEETLCE